MYDKKSMTKKAWQQKQKEMRKMNGFNTGERMFDTPKHQSRAKIKKIFKKYLTKSVKSIIINLSNEREV